jgi:sugar phosphate isomerase/epimerase
MREKAVAISNDNKGVTVLETIDAIYKAGFKNVFIQWYNKDFDINQQQQLEYVKKLGLNVIFAHLGYQNINSLWEENEEGELLVKRYKQDIKICKENNIDMVVMHLTSKSKAPIHNEIGLCRIRKIVDYAKELNVKVAFENTKIKGYLEYVIQNIENENVGICYDSGHCHVHFDDEFNYEIFNNRIFAVHLHDNDKSDDLHLLPFDGTIDWNKVIKSLKKCNYDGLVTLELCYTNEYMNLNIDEFYKKGYEVACDLAKMF